MSRHQPVYLEKVVYNLRGGFLVRPLIIAVLMGCTGAGLSTLEVAYPAIGGIVPRVFFPSRLDHQVAQTILATIAGSVMTVVSIVFAILLMSLTLASMQFSPRIIVSFTKDRVTQWTLGVFLGTFSYCLSAPSRCSFASQAVLSRRNRNWRHAACLGLRGLALILYSSHLAIDQRELHRRSDRNGN
jgi:uncharacterized membrane protein